MKWCGLLGVEDVKLMLLHREELLVDSGHEFFEQVRLQDGGAKVSARCASRVKSSPDLKMGDIPGWGSGIEPEVPRYPDSRAFEFDLEGAT